MITSDKQSIRKAQSFAGVVAFTLTQAKTIREIFININALPLTSELLTVKLVSGSGSQHILLSIDPSVATGTQWDQWFTLNLGLAEGDSIVVDYTNTDANTVAVLAHYEEL
jgi:hypothetical protein